jgi:hypothetical protein
MFQSYLLNVYFSRETHAVARTFVLILLSLVCCIACGPTKQKLGAEAVSKIEDFKRVHGRIPNSLLEVGVREDESGPYYCRTSDEDYIVWYGTTLGESVQYSSKTKYWREAGGEVCASKTELGSQKQSPESASYTTSYCTHGLSYIGLQRVHITSTLAEQMTRKTVPPQPMTTAGDAVLMVLVGKDGKVMCALGLLGEKELVNTALAAVSQWEYSPYFLDGQPVVFETKVTIHFKPKTK